MLCTSISVQHQPMSPRLVPCPDRPGARGEGRGGPHAHTSIADDRSRASGRIATRTDHAPVATTGNEPQAHKHSRWSVAHTPGARITSHCASSYTQPKNCIDRSRSIAVSASVGAPCP
eukprot:2265471-Prymnesium_polylepis.1